MGKKIKNKTESPNDESQTQSGIFTTLFSGDVVGAESSGFSSLFSDDNPFRRKQPPVIKDRNSPNTKKGDKRNADAEIQIEEVSVLPVKTKKSKKENKLKAPVSDSGANEAVEKETNSDVVEEPVLDSKRKKRKRDEIENEYETKKYEKYPPKK